MNVVLRVVYSSRSNMCSITVAFIVALTASGVLTVPTRNNSNNRVLDRSLRIGGSSSATTTTETSSNGFSVSFVPLFSLLANFIPRILSRFSGVNSSKARSFGNSSASTEYYDDNDGKLCSPTHLGQWPDNSNCKQFYICKLNSNCTILTSSLNTKDKVPIHEQNEDYIHIYTVSMNCTILKVFQCQEKFMYNSKTQKCEPEMNSTILCKQT